MASSTLQFLLWLAIFCCIGTLLLLYSTADLTVQGFIPKPSLRNFSTLLLRENTTTQKAGYLVYTNLCKIRNQDPYDISIKSLLKKGTPPFICDRFKSFTYQDNDILYINYTAVNSSIYNNTFTGCYVRPIHRPVTARSGHNTVAYLMKSKIFKTHYQVKHEYVHVKCLNNKDTVVYENYHSFVFRKRNVENKCKFRFQQRKQKSLDTFNIMIIGLDSVSRLNSMRHLKQTRQCLLEDMKAIELLGYNKVGDNTFDNMVPLLTGKYPKELPWSTENKTFFDRFNFAWKNFSEQGYRTLFLEDLPHGAIFDYVKPGFHSNPTDYYNRHFQLMMLNAKDGWYADKNCLVDRTQTELVMNFTYRFMTTFKNDPYFGFVFITRLTHDILEQTAAADDIYYNYMKEIHQNNLLNNTILIFMSDHGIRFGAIRSYFIGKMEERLPMFYVVLPERFRLSYPNRVKNLQENARKLTTPFDVYETLMDLINLKSDDDGRDEELHLGNYRGYSLLKRIPDERSCENASIDPHWCTCSRQQAISVTDTSVIKSSQYLITQINSKLKKVRELCISLRVMETLSAYKLKAGNNDLNKQQSVLQLNVRTAPGGGIFEATVVFDEIRNKYSLGGDVSRINSYAKEKRCPVEHRLEKLCYCRSNLS